MVTVIDCVITVISFPPDQVQNERAIGILETLFKEYLQVLMTSQMFRRQLESKARGYLKQVWKVCPMNAKWDLGHYKGL